MVAIENRKVLVLNKHWTPVAVVPMKRAIKLATTNYEGTDVVKANVVGFEFDPVENAIKNFASYSWADWAAMRPKEDEPCIRGVKENYRVPEILVLHRYDRMPQQRVHFSRKTLYKRDNQTCQYCGCKPGTEELTIDHIIPRAQGGQTTWTNCVIACTECNAQKADKRPEQAFKPADPKKRAKWKGPSPMRLLSQPYKPKFTLFKSDYRVKSWESFLGVMYWSVELDNDNAEQYPDDVRV